MPGFFERLFGYKKALPVPSQDIRPAKSLSLEVTMASSSSSRSEFDIGPLTETPKGWLLNPNSASSVTVYGITRDQAVELKKILDDPSLNFYEARNRLPAFVARSNVKWRELDDYVTEFRPRYLAKIEDQKAASSEWPAASDPDRKDMLMEFRQVAIQSLDTRPFVDLEVFFEGEPEDPSIDDAMLDRYGHELLQTYFRYSHNLKKVHTSAADAYDRKSFEGLVAKGLAVQGSNVPIDDILANLTLKELNAFAGEAPKPFTRKAKAIEWLQQQADLPQRLSKTIAFRELFQLRPLPTEFQSLDAAKLGAAWRYAAEFSGLLAHTYSFCASAARDVLQGQEIATGWEIFADDTSCMACKRAASKTYPKSTPPRVPVHIGCRCLPQVKS